MKKIPLIKPEIDAVSLSRAIKNIAKTGILTKGPYLDQFQKSLEKYLCVKHAFATTSCTTALHLALVALDIKDGDEVLVSDFSFPASANVIVQVGAKPIFVDIDLKTFCLDLEDLKRKISKKTKAIMVVHAFGYPADMSEIAKIAKKHHLLVIEDAACAIGSKHKDKFCGTWGDVGCFSFHPRKVITTAEGGAIVTNNPEIAKKIEILRNHGGVITEEGWEFVEVGFNYRLSELQAALGVDQMKNVRKIIAGRIKSARKILKKLKNIPGIQLPEEPKDGVFNFQSLVILLPDKIDRADLISFMKKKNVEVILGTYAMHREPAYRRFGYKPGDLKNSDFAYHHSLTLPLYEKMTEKDINYVAINLAEYLRKHE